MEPKERQFEDTRVDPVTGLGRRINPDFRQAIVNHTLKQTSEDSRKMEEK